MEASPLNNRSSNRSRKSFTHRKSRIERTSIANLIHDTDELAKQTFGASAYEKVLNEAKRATGAGARVGAFPEEWDAQLLVDAGLTAEGYRVMIFTPIFLQFLVGEESDLDRAFHYILLAMDRVARRERYDFVYCHIGNWTNAAVQQRFNLAYEILPRYYALHLKHLYILHPTAAVRVSLWTGWTWISGRLWRKIECFESLDELCLRLQPEDVDARAEIRRHFPLLVQREDATRFGAPVPTTFGIPLHTLCGAFGVDHVDNTTGRCYSRLPPALMFLCGALHRQAADDAFHSLFTADAAATYSLVAAVDEGQPLDPEIPLPTLWCALKLFLDCLPSPALSYRTFEDLKQCEIAVNDTDSQRAFLLEVIRNRLSEEAAHMTLYLSSFLHTMCKNAEQRAEVTRRLAPRGAARDGLQPDVMTPRLAAEIFAPGFLRPQCMSLESLNMMPVVIAIVETLIRCGDDPEFRAGLLPSFGAHKDSSRLSVISSDDESHSDF